MKKEIISGHFLCILCILIWGSALISTKILLVSFSPLEMLFLRFLIGYVTLWVLCPKRVRLNGFREHLICCFCGLMGVTLYFLFQNVALVYTTASNISVIVAMAPMFTAILMYIGYKKEPLNIRFVFGFFLSMIGIVMVVFNGKFELKGNMFGDLLAVGAALFWSFYSVVIKKMEKYSPLILTRKVFFYGLVTMIPLLIYSEFSIDVGKLLKISSIGNLIYMGAFASAICYAIWNKSFQILGTVKTNIYLYTLPIGTIIFSTLFLNEKISVMRMIGVLLTVAGLIVSQQKEKSISSTRKKEEEK